MKRLKIFILTVLISLSIFTVGFAADSKLTTEELFNKWTKEGIQMMLVGCTMIVI